MSILLLGCASLTITLCYNYEGKNIMFVLTIGHSTLALENFINLLKANNVAKVVDIRTIPRSRHNPQFNKATLPISLNLVGIGYLHMRGLGGLRHPVKDSLNSGWQNASFRGFADYMQTVEFRENIQELIELAKKEQIILMCAEAVPWRCHRSLIADALLIRGVKVEHVLGTTHRRPHIITPWAKVTGLNILYPTR